MEKALEWKFEGYENMHVICNYITYEYGNNVTKAFNDLGSAIEYMDDNDMWDDYYIYYIGDDGHAYEPNF